jgi:hypothetical protein
MFADNASEVGLPYGATRCERGIAPERLMSALVWGGGI